MTRASSISGGGEKGGGPRILSVGQCGADSRAIASLLTGQLGATVDAAATAADARRKVGATPYRLVLVNRIFDADGDSGLSLIGELAGMAGGPPVMLVSDRADAQTSAVAAGAMPGFGKAALRQPGTLATIKRALGASARAQAVVRDVQIPPSQTTP